MRSTRIAPCVHNVSRNVGPVYQDTIALGYTLNTGRGAAGGMLRTRGVFTVVTTHHESGHWAALGDVRSGLSIVLEVRPAWLRRGVDSSRRRTVTNNRRLIAEHAAV